MTKDKQAVEKLKEHELKTWCEYFGAVACGEKTFEVRKNDRGFKVGDTVILKEYDYEVNVLTGKVERRKITYILDGGNFGIEEGYCVLGLETRQPDVEEVLGKVEKAIKQHGAIGRGFYQGHSKGERDMHVNLESKLFEIRSALQQTKGEKE